MNTFTLDKLPLDTCCTVISLNCSGPIHRRLLDLGLVQNTPIKAVLKSPFGDPTAYEVRGSTIALRMEDAMHILVSS